MNGIYYAIVSVCLLVFQTIVKPAVPFLDGFYDLLVPFIIYLSMFRRIREALPVILILGAVMDNLSGAPFGLYLTVYIWLFLATRGIIKLLRVGNTLLLPAVIVAGVLIENLIFIGIIGLLMPGTLLPQNVGRTVGVQLVWAAFTGPFVLGIMDFSLRQWESFCRLWFRKASEEDA